MCRRTVLGLWIVLAGMTVAAGCGDVNAALEKLADARGYADDLLVQFTKAADAANLAVLADTDEGSAAYAEQAEQAKAAVQKDIDTLGTMLQSMGYTDENRLLQDFVTHFAEYRALDARVLDLAVQNTNLKAQRLSFGPAQEAADAFRDAVESLASSAPPADSWRTRALAETALAALRDIQAEQAPHIADPNDEAMARMEQRMAASEHTVRSALATLGPIVPAASKTKLTAAAEAFDRFMNVNAQILVLSHRNTNVRSLALSLDEKRPVTAACEDRLHALHDALAKRGRASGR